MSRFCLALIAGILNVLAFAPFNWWPLSLASFSMLFSVWLLCNTKQAFWTGFAFGLGQFGVGVSWMYVSLNTFGGMSPAIAAFSIFIGVSIISLYPALCGLAQALLKDWHPAVRVGIFMPSIWIVFEWIRSLLFSGFPFLMSGYAFLDTPLANFAPIGGVFMVGYIALLIAGALIAVARNTTLRNGPIAGFMVAIWIAGWQLNDTSWSHAFGESIQVSVIQNNISLTEKWNQQSRGKIVGKYMEKSIPLTESDLIVWPEAAVPDYLDTLANSFWQEVEAHPADFIFGVLYRDSTIPTANYYNSAVSVTDRIMIYRKTHLVPFGEYLPLKWLFSPLMDMMQIPMSDFSAWDSPQGPLHAADNKFALSICYEDAFPAEMRSQIPSSGALLNISEDIWFGDSFAPHQRLQMARFRARESERPMIRASNNGLSSLINWKGGIDKHAPQFKQAVVTGKIQPRTGVTPYVAFGDSPTVSLALLMLLLGVIFGRPRRLL